MRKTERSGGAVRTRPLQFGVFSAAVVWLVSQVTLQPVPEAVIAEIVDEIFLPLVAST